MSTEWESHGEELAEITACLVMIVYLERQIYAHGLENAARLLGAASLDVRDHIGRMPPRASAA